MQFRQPQNCELGALIGPIGSFILGYFRVDVNETVMTCSDLSASHVTCLSNEAINTRSNFPREGAPGSAVSNQARDQTSIL